MKLIKTPSFELAVNLEGNIDSKHLAILIPGRLDTKDYANFVSHSKYLAARGFLVVSFDPPGTWDSLGDIELYTTTNYLKVIDELIAYFGNRPTLLVGHSRGGTVSMLAASNPAVIGMILLMANFGMPTPPDDEARKLGFQVSFRDMPPGDSITPEQKEFQLPMSYWDDGAHYNPVIELQKYEKPKLLIDGTTDEFYNPDEISKLYSTLPEPKMIKEIESDHDYRYNKKAIDEVEAIMGQFLDKYFKTWNQ